MGYFLASEYQNVWIIISKQASSFLISHKQVIIAFNMIGTHQSGLSLRFWQEVMAKILRPYELVKEMAGEIMLLSWRENREWYALFKCRGWFWCVACAISEHPYSALSSHRKEQLGGSLHYWKAAGYATQDSLGPPLQPLTLLREHMNMLDPSKTGDWERVFCLAHLTNRRKSHQSILRVTSKGMTLKSHITNLLCNLLIQSKLWFYDTHYKQ